MVDGQVSTHRPENMRRIQAEKNNPIVREIEKTKVERNDIDLSQIQNDREREIQQAKKQHYKQMAAVKLKEKKLALQEKEARSYDVIMNSGNMTSNTEREGTADAEAAEEYEDDFM
jgi:N-acetylglutamate synthase/N-acetylornithine aminotransferase